MIQLTKVVHLLLTNDLNDLSKGNPESEVEQKLEQCTQHKLILGTRKWVRKASQTLSL